MPPTTETRPRWRWDLFCRVVDNYGDAGVCWRLAADLAARGHTVRLWIDDATPLRWMAPDGHPGVEVRPWPADDDPLSGVRPGDVVVEAFGCDPPSAFIAAMAAAATSPAGHGRPPVWINLEYLSAEDWVARSHGLRSPRQVEPGRGLDKWFWFPGFTDGTGGLLREPGLVEALDALDADAWRAAHGLVLDAARDERLASVFCYPDSDLAGLLRGLAAGGERWCVALAPGAATALGRALPEAARPAAVRLVDLPFLPQADYDRLLAASDLNVVRGEDSFVRAQWAGRPFLWQAYRQDDGVHAVKLAAFLGRLRVGSASGDAEVAEGPDAFPQDTWGVWDAWHRRWNGLSRPGEPPPPPWTPALRVAIEAAARRWRDRLLARPDLVTGLLAFVEQRR